MIGNVDLDLLEKTYQNATIGITAIEGVIDKTSNKELNNDLYKQMRDYQELADKSRKHLKQHGAQAKEKPFYDRAMMKGNVKLNTLMDSSDSRIAQMVIQGSTMGVTQMTKLLHASENADGTCTEIAKEFISKEEANIETMKKYL
jgi:bacterioferritin-associated ferredoxin